MSDNEWLRSQMAEVDFSGAEFIRRHRVTAEEYAIRMQGEIERLEQIRIEQAEIIRQCWMPKEQAIQRANRYRAICWLASLSGIAGWVMWFWNR